VISRRSITLKKISKVYGGYIHFGAQETRITVSEAFTLRFSLRYDFLALTLRFDLGDRTGTSTFFPGPKGTLKYKKNRGPVPDRDLNKI